MRAEKFDDGTICLTVDRFGSDFEFVSLMPIEVKFCKLKA
jgi:hypothetical protein